MFLSSIYKWYGLFFIAISCTLINTKVINYGGLKFYISMIVIPICVVFSLCHPVKRPLNF